MPRPDVSDIRQEQILNAALELFSETGIEATSMSAIAKKCNLSKATIYHYFDSKETMVLALLDNIFTHDDDAFQALQDQNIPVTQRLMNYTQSYSELIQQQPQLFGVFFEFYSNAIRQETMQTKVSAYFDTYLNIFTKVFQQGYNSAEFTKGNPQLAAETFMSLVEGTVIMSFIRQTDLAKRIQQSTQLFLDSLS